MSVGIRGRLLIQNCISASLQLNWDQIKDGTGEAEFAEIGSGLVAYVCFKKEADQTTVDKIVKILLEGGSWKIARMIVFNFIYLAKIWNAHGKPEPMNDCDLLLVPQVGEDTLKGRVEFSH